MKNYTYVNEPDVRYDGKSLVAACIEKASKLTTNDLMKVLFSDGDKIADQDFSPLLEEINISGTFADMKSCTGKIQKAKAKAFAELVSRLPVDLSYIPLRMYIRKSGTTPTRSRNSS